jgi:hypothetical protein
MPAWIVPGAGTQQLAVGPHRLVVVLVNGGSLSPDWVKHHVPTVLEAFEGGQSGGTALAEVLAGDVSPSGVLPYTMCHLRNRSMATEILD